MERSEVTFSGEWGVLSSEAWMNHQVTYASGGLLGREQRTHIEPQELRLEQIRIALTDVYDVELGFRDAEGGRSEGLDHVAQGLARVRRLAR